jgi:hypothetical protein
MDIEWNVNCIPPVGTVCEWRHGESHDWTKITIIAYHLDNAWVFHGNSNLPATIKVRGKSYFRPIRTPEQIAADEREAAVNNAFSVIRSKGWDIPSEDADYLYCLYDAGLLKT